jgi:ribosome-binding factor A
MPAGRRNERLAEEIREEVAHIVGGEMKDPRLGFVTITRVALTADLRTARVLVSVLGSPKERAKSLGILRRASGFVRRELGRRLNIRHTPEVLFQHDDGLDNSDRVAKLLDEVGTAEGQDAGGAEPEDE